MCQIKRAIIKPSRRGVRLDELHRQIPLRGKFARELQHSRLAVQADQGRRLGHSWATACDPLERRGSP
jgi:hypothetical protein